MLDVNRPLGHLRPLAMAGLLGLVACSSPDSASSGDAPSPATPAASAPPPTTPASGEPVSSSPGSESIDPSIPTSLASASAVARATWRALEAVDAGDAEAMSLVMTSDARWFPPGSVEESVDNQPGTMARAMAPWSGPDVELSVRRVIEPGYGPVVVQLAVDRVSSPGAGNELVLLIKGRGEQMQTVRQYGDALGPLRFHPEDRERTLDLGPIAEPTWHAGPADDAAMAVVEALGKAIEARDEAAVRAQLADGVRLHDVKARRTREGEDGFLEGMRGTLGEDGHLVALHQFGAGETVVVEGAVYGLEADDEGNPREHGFADVHRLAGGEIVETWHYLNRRGRPSRRKQVVVPPRP